GNNTMGICNNKDARVDEVNRTPKSAAQRDVSGGSRAASTASTVANEYRLLNGCFDITLHEGDGFSKEDLLSQNDAFCEVRDQQRRRLLKTAVVKNSKNPVWNMKQVVSMTECSQLCFVVKDSDVGPDDELGLKVLKASCSVLSPLFKGEAVSAWISLEGGSRRARIPRVRVTIKPMLHKLPGTLGVHSSTFAPHTQCRVTLFQSAHVGSERSYLPDIKVYTGSAGGTKKKHKNPKYAFCKDDNLDGERVYQPRNAWEEMYITILEARHFIYVIGWSVNVDVSLLRERNIEVSGYEGLDGRKLKFGDLLIKKANEGVTVCVSLWNGVGGSAAFDFPGIMGTYAAITQDYLKGSRVHVDTFVRRGEDLKRSAANALLYSHHQKCIVCDAPALAGSHKPRRLVGFVGGIDITKGRFSTPLKHMYGEPLRSWTTGTTTDFYNPCLDGASIDNSPQMPWQDIHSKVEGGIVHDLVANFEERWLFQADDDLQKALYNITHNPDILSLSDENVVSPDSTEAWTVQMFRSIDSTSSAKVHGVEGGIHHAYDNAIAKAERFIYLENQYFMGASKWWLQGNTKVEAFLSKFVEDDNSVNRVPLMIVRRIVKAIKAKTRFAAYITIPLFPEGEPDSAAMQEILYWQYNTIEMMYTMIAAALKESGSSGHPTDYLNFFCLGKREPKATTSPSSNGRKGLIAKSKRHMIYVHSKMLIVDDDYVIVGSANINDRAQEIAIPKSALGHTSHIFHVIRVIGNRQVQFMATVSLCGQNT
ncbi:Phospholipase D alpha 1, partial [Diplonema papillatum]